MKKKPASMRVVKPMPETTKGKTCGECMHPIWNEENRDYKGYVFIGRCKWSQYGRVTEQGGLTYADYNACEHFAPKTKGEPC